MYFDEATAADVILANYPTILTRNDFSITIENTTTGTIYYEDTSKGRTYYFAGNPTDNWVYFAGFYWRIIRINEDESIRMIYQGTSANTTGTGTRIQQSAFNSSRDNNMYVGYMYTEDQVHGLGTDSVIKGILDEWYENNLRENYSQYISTEAGFCGDRQPSTSEITSNGSGGTGTTETWYGAYIRLYINKEPTIECQNSSDLYTVASSSQGNKALNYPIGLISIDEVAYAGGLWGTSNQNYYLYTGYVYWTMTPCHGDAASVFNVYSNGEIGGNYPVDNASYGVRPVINLSSDIQITGSGTSTDPYTVVGA